MSNKEVFVPKPELTIFKDTFIKGEIIKDEGSQYRIKIKSVHLKKGTELPDLTAEHENEIISVKKSKAHDDIQSVQLALSNND